MVIRPPFPMVIDSSMLSEFRSCPTKCRRTYFEHWKTPSRNVHLHAGGAFAEALEHARRAYYNDKKSREDAEIEGLRALFSSYGPYDPGEDHPKSLKGMAGALAYYYDAFPFDQDPATPIPGPAGHAIEFSFVLPLDLNHPETGEPLLFSGRADWVANFLDGLFIFDEKTTSQLGSSWGRQWELRSQFTAYTWAARQMGLPVQGVVVRGVAIRKNGYDHAQHIVYRAEWEIERWQHETNKTLRRMIDQWHSGDWDYNLDHACADYGGCVFQRICRSPSPEEWLKMDFIRSRWDPVTRQETLVEA